MDKKKMQLVNWPEVVKFKGKGGFGLGNLKNKCLTLLAKWWWRLGEEEEALCENIPGERDQMRWSHC